MEVGIKQAKIDLSKLVTAARQGKKVYLLNRGKRVAEILPVYTRKENGSALRGYGMFRDELKAPPDWNSPQVQEKEEAELMDMLSEW